MKQHKNTIPALRIRMFNKFAATFSLALLCSALLTAPATVRAEEVRVAVASNFRVAMQELVRVFEDQSDHSLLASFASSGIIFAQITQGAPYDVFLSADSSHAAQLESRGLAVPGSRFTYATGTLVLWRPAGGATEIGPGLLESGEFRFLAMANPELAPYGMAARQTLGKLELWNTLQSRIIRGQNAGQAFAFVASGNAQLGFVALSQVLSSSNESRGDWWVVPQVLHDPIEQQAVLVSNREGGRDFMSFLVSERAGEIIRRHGYLRER